MLHAIMESAGSELPGGDDNIERYTDAKDVSGYAKEAMDFMLDAELIQGTGGASCHRSPLPIEGWRELMYNYLVKTGKLLKNQNKDELVSC